MLNTLKIENFTVFKKADLQFSPGLNVIVGENGTGKSHLLKLGYAVLRAVAKGGTDVQQSLYPLQKSLEGVFGTQQIADLIRKNGEQRGSHLSVSWGEQGKWNFQLDPIHGGISDDGVVYEKIRAKLLFIPTKEILSVYRGFRAALKMRELSFDETYLDLAEALDVSPFKGDKLAEVNQCFAPLEALIQAEVMRDDAGNFYFIPDDKQQKGRADWTDSRSILAQMTAEGHRKLGMLSYLIKNGSLEPGSSLFWDEPEANLNPKLLVALAHVLVELSKVMQITIATHSLFLLRELEILQEEKKLKNARYFGLYLGEDGVMVEQGDSANDIGDITALDASIDQSTRYLQYAYEE